MNKLIEQIDKVINKKGSLKTPAFYIKKILTDIVDYFDKKITNLINDIERIKSTINKINSNIKNIPKGVVYAGYSNGSDDIKDIYRSYFVLSNDPKYSSWIVIYSIKEIKEIKVISSDNDVTITNMDKFKYNNLFVYRFNLYLVFQDWHWYHIVHHSVNVKYVDNTEEYISLMTSTRATTLSTVMGSVKIHTPNGYKSIAVYTNNYIEHVVDIPKDATSFALGGGSENEDITVKCLINNNKMSGDYVKETDNDKLILKFTKP